MSNHKLDICGCCKGEKRVTPGDTYNRPGLDALAYRVGTHAAFFETMIAALARQKIAFETADERGQEVTRQERPLEQLKTRRRDDFSIALLDAWATIADVLAFYQERIANEGYLRTATERRSILELARLVGYELRPGVSASTFLSFIVEQAQKAALIPKGTRAQSVPQPGETMESFETMRDLEARYEYNELKLRTAQAQFLQEPGKDGSLPPILYLPGQRNDLRPSDRLLLVFGTVDEQGVLVLEDEPSYWLAQVRSTDLLEQPVRTAITLQPGSLQIGDPPDGDGVAFPSWNLGFLSPGTVSGVVLTETKSMQAGGIDLAKCAYHIDKPWNYVVDAIASSGAVTSQLPEAVFGDASSSDAGLQGAAVLNTQFAENIYPTMGQEVAPLSPDERALRAVILLRLQAHLHGHNAPWQATITQTPTGDGGSESKATLSEWPDPNPTPLPIELDNYNREWRRLFGEWKYRDVNGMQHIVHIPVVTLDSIYDQIGLQSQVVLAWDQAGEHKLALFQIATIDAISTSLFNVPSTATRLHLAKLAGDDWNPTTMAIVRSTTVYVGTERVTNPVPYRVLAEKPVADELLGGENVVLELDGICAGLKPGRWIALTGLRTDIPVIGREVALVGAVEHRFVQRDDGKDLPGDLRHTFLTLATPLGLSYWRATVIINANVVPATHGETARGVPPREQDVILGSGDAAQAHQRLALKLLPEKRLTYLSAPTRDGVESTLQVYVNDVLWDWRSTLLGAGPRDHVYTVQTGDEGETDVIFGDGREGARPPTGRENVFARYRVGIGKAGNVKAEQISLLATRPSGVKEVINPVPATGGTDPEGRDQARQNVPFAARTLDRLVGLPDYQDFARTFAGIGRAHAQKGDGTIERALFGIRERLDPESLPVLPPEEVGPGVRDITVHIKKIDGGASRGYRFVGHWGPRGTPVTNQGLRYIYQGLTKDRQGLVTFFHPVRAKGLPGAPADVPLSDMIALRDDLEAYFGDIELRLKNLKASDWDPKLDLLDKLVQSLELQPGGGIVLDAAELGLSFECSDIPGTPYDKTRLRGASGLPQHTLITFHQVADPADKSFRAAMYIVSTEAYQALYEQAVIVYVASEDNAPLTQDSAVIRNLKLALDRHDGSNMAIAVVAFTPRLITLDATVAIAPDRLWERVQPAILKELARVFGFGRRDLGQPVALSAMVDTIQRVPGVVHVQVTRFATLTREQLEDQASQAQAANQSVEELIPVSVDELAFIDPAASALIVLKQAEA